METKAHSKNDNFKVSKNKKIKVTAKRKTTVKSKRVDIYQKVTDAIISSLEKGVKPWDMKGCTDMPSNLKSGAQYSGIKILYGALQVKAGLYRHNGSLISKLSKWAVKCASARKAPLLYFIKHT